jgi:twinkle protein
VQAAESLANLLLSHGIKPKRWTPGPPQQLRCPKCNGGSNKVPCLTLTIDPDGDGAVWTCHRGTCGFTDGARISRHPKPDTTPTPRDKPRPLKQTNYKPDWFNAFFEERGIGDRAVTLLGIHAMEDCWFPEPVGSSRAIIFPYRHKGEVVNRKYRPFPAKNPMRQEKNAAPTLFNGDHIGETTIFVEGEMDVAAIVECGLKHVVSLKDGAPAKVSDNDGKRYEALKTHEEELGKARKFILAGDMDAPGLALREELARRLGRHKCDVVTWPEGCKDAGETLQRLGAEAVLGALSAAAPYPIDGLQQVSASCLLALRSQPAPSTMTTGVSSVDAIVHIPTDGRCIVVTGYPNMGKTSFLRAVMVHTAKAHNRRWGVFTPEMMPWEQFAANCAEVLIGKPFWPTAGYEQMTLEEVGRAGAWLQDRVSLLVCDSEDEAPTLDWIFERLRAAVLRYGITDFLIDPWNEMDHSRANGTTETDHIGRSLQRIKAFCRRHGVNAWIIAHPAKPFGFKTGEAKPPPGPYDISGSAHWANKPDLGITVHGDELHLWKARFRLYGRRGDWATMSFDPVTGRYDSAIKDAVPDWRPQYNDD